MTSMALRQRSPGSDCEYATLLRHAFRMANETEPISRNHATCHQGETFDVAAALQAAHIMASGENTDRVLTNLMRSFASRRGPRALSCSYWKGTRFGSRPVRRSKAEV